MTPKAIMNGKTNPNQRDAQSSRKVITFAVTYEQVRFERLSFFGDTVEIHPLPKPPGPPAATLLQLA